MDKSCINRPKNSKKYLDRVHDFIKFGMEKSLNRKILCPYRKCINSSSLDPQNVEEHLVWNGFLRGYTDWIFYGESMLPSSCNQPLTHFESTSLQDNSARDDDIRGLITDAFGLSVQNLGESSSIQETEIGRAHV